MSMVNRGCSRFVINHEYDENDSLLRVALGDGKGVLPGVYSVSSDAENVQRASASS